MDQQQQQLTERIKQAQNILVTVSRNPSVDQLAAAIGLTLVLNKLDKHGTAVFSGEVPSTLEFLKPEDTLEKNTDSLRDFIIALDKSKADKLRYKVEDEVVRIFITPYKTSISEKDLDFSQGDFNVDVVVALGVTEQQDLDGAITAHGRILHDATVASVSTEGQGSLGSINWVEPTASSLSEMVVSLADSLDKKVMDSQIATALLTGIVATTDRFRNEKTSPKTMSASAELMAAGANQQLVATELEAAVKVDHTDTPPEEPAGDDSPENQPEPEPEQPKSEPGTLEIDHEQPEPEMPSQPEPPKPQVHVDENGQLITLEGDETPMPEISTVRGVSATGRPTESAKPEKSEVSRERVTEPPQVNTGDLTANTTPEGLDPAAEELTLPPVETPLLKHNESVLPPTPPIPVADPAGQFIPQAPLETPPAAISPDETLSEIEKSLGSPHVGQPEQSAPDTEPTASVDDARSAVEAALNNAAAPSNPLEPITALNAQPLGSELHAAQSFEQPGNLPASPSPVQTHVPNTGFSEPTPGTSPADETLDMPLPPSPFGASQGQNSLPPVPPSTFPGAPAPDNQQSKGNDSAPPVPPPFIPPLQ